jgi:hypothetical protein
VLRAPVALQVVQVAQVALRVVQVDLARLVPVVRVALVQVSVAVLAQVSVVQALALVVQVLLALVASVVLVRVPVAVVAAEEQQVPSVRVAHVAHPRPASRSVRNAKSLNREWLRASVAQLCHVATAPLLFVCVVEQASRTSPTRLMPMPVS